MTRLQDRHIPVLYGRSWGTTTPSTADDEALLSLGSWLAQKGYRFVTPTPATHARVNARPQAVEATSLHDVFGWSRPFHPDLLPPTVLHWLEQGGGLDTTSGLLRSKVRFSSLGDSLYMHSAYPTVEPDAVFFGPDTYRFAALIGRTLATSGSFRPACVVDIGCGTGAGGIVAVKELMHPPKQVIMTDINPIALRYTRINSALSGIAVPTLRQGDLFDIIDDPIDLLVANPPYLLDPRARLYRHGGGELGSALSTRIVTEGLPRIAAGGMLILYTGTPIINGRDTFLESIQPVLDNPKIRHEYRELDPDVFGEQLEYSGYAQVDRIAVVTLIIKVASPVHTSITRVMSMSRSIPMMTQGKPYWRNAR